MSLRDNTRTSLGFDLLAGMPEAAPDEEPTLDQRVEDAYETMREAAKVIDKARHTEAYYALWNTVEDALGAAKQISDPMYAVKRENAKTK